jgi:hypothetical protein
VLSGLDRGIKTLSAVAFTLGAVVFLGILYADNTWYVLNVAVQTTGNYLQYLIQFGFDCEAFQQLGFEIDPDYNPEDTPRSSAGYFNAHRLVEQQPRDQLHPDDGGRPRRGARVVPVGQRHQQLPRRVRGPPRRRHLDHLPPDV